MAVTWVGNKGSSVSWSFCFLVRVRDSGVTGGGGGGISPGGAVGGGGGVVLELGFSTLGVLENALIGAFSVFPFEVPPAL